MEKPKSSVFEKFKNNELTDLTQTKAGEHYSTGEGYYGGEVIDIKVSEYLWVVGDAWGIGYDFIPK